MRHGEKMFRKQNRYALTVFFAKFAPTCAHRDKFFNLFPNRHMNFI